MPKFKLRVTRDASVTFEAEVEAENEDAIALQMSRHGYGGEILGDWEEVDVTVFDEVEDWEVR